MKYAIFTDVDGTIYGRDRLPMKETLKDIKMAQSKGIEVIISTGNPYLKSMRHLAKLLDVNYFIGSNGGVIVDVKKDEFISSKTIEIKEAQKILDLSLELGIGAHWWNEKELFVSKDVNQEIITLLKEVILIDVEPIKSDQINNPINKIELYGDPDKLDKAMKILKGGDYNLARIKPVHLEITNKGVSKGHALIELSKMLEIDLENTMSIGDSANDHTMFEVSNHSYAMANGDKLTHELSNHYTSRYDQNGLGEAILDFMFRNRLTDNFHGKK